jgi:hypothetical protein
MRGNGLLLRSALWWNLTMMGHATLGHAAPALPREAEAARVRLAEARKALDSHPGGLGAKQRETLHRQLQKAETALQNYVRLHSKYQEKQGSQQAAAAPLVAAGAIVLADDASAVGVVDDVLLPFIGIALLVTQFKPHAPPDQTELSIAWNKTLHELEALGKEATQINEAQGYVPPPASLHAFPHAKATKPKGQGKLRRRWVDAENGWILEWDYQHGTVEKYDRRGKHLGEFDPGTGTQTKPANPSRKIDP